MPHASIWFSEEWTNQDIKDFMDQVADIAEKLGYITHGGPKAGRGNIRSLMEGLVAGDLVILTRQEYNRINHPGNNDY